MWLLLSTRLRTWLFVALVLPLFGRVLEAVGIRVGQTRPRAGVALTGAGQRMRNRGRKAPPRR